VPSAFHITYTHYRGFTSSTSSTSMGHYQHRRVAA